MSLWRLFLVFLEIGSVLYGSGYVLLAFLESRLVDDLGWLTNQQLLDAVAVGQITPGPVFTTATFVGWRDRRPARPSRPSPSSCPRSCSSPSWAASSRGCGSVRAPAPSSAGSRSSLGLMAGVLVELIGTALIDVPTVLIALVALACCCGPG